MTIEKKNIQLGYVTLTDSLPLIAAQHLGYFAAEGLNVSLSNEPSWANIRDKTVLGELDGAQMLAPMVLASTLGSSGVAVPMLTMFSINLNGNGMTVSNDLWAQLGEVATSPEPLDVARAMANLITRRDRITTLATVFPVSMHSYLLRYFLAAGGLHDWSRVRIVVVPPVRMVSHLKQGHIDGCCVGEPWNTMAELAGVGRPLVTGYEIWQNAPEKVFGVTEAWARSNPETHRAIVRALARSSRWIEENPGDALLMRDRQLQVREGMEPLPNVKWGLDRTHRGAEHFHVFHKYAANFPWRSHARWIFAQMQAWNQIPTDVDPGVVARCYRTDLYREVFAESALPVEDDKPEGVHRAEWNDLGVTLGPDLFLDRQIESK